MNFTKICTVCQIEYPATTEFFHKCSCRSKYGIKSYCKKCGNKNCLERYYQNREKNLKKQKEWLSKNKEKRNKQQREYSYKNKHKRNEYLKNKMKEDMQFRIRKNIRDRMRLAMCGSSKSKHTIELLGCSVEELKKHLEKQFTEGMNWDNYGKKGWHIDHILPCASFDLTDPEQQKRCFHYTNLQPLWAEDNYKKRDKIL
jgi:flagellar hook protein FlgE